MSNEKPTTSKWAEVRGSEVHGRGMFATRAIPDETEIIEYRGERIDKEESERRGQELFEEGEKTGGARVYMFTLDETWDLDGNVEWNTARLINHSCDPNCEAQIDDDLRVWLVATRKISKGEELTFNYGFDTEDYENHPCCCAADNCVGYIVGEDYWGDLKKKLKKKRAKAERKAKKGKGSKKGKKAKPDKKRKKKDK